MKSVMRVLVLFGAVALLAGCNNAQLATFQNGVKNFQTGVATVNDAIRSVSADLAQNCDEAVVIGSALVDLLNATGSKSAQAGLAGVNAGINAYCQKPPTNIATAVASIAAQVRAGKAAYTAAKKGN